MILKKGGGCIAITRPIGLCDFFLRLRSSKLGWSQKKSPELCSGDCSEVTSGFEPL
jgi:hypothetical protein